MVSGFCYYDVLASIVREMGDLFAVSIDSKPIGRWLARCLLSSIVVSEMGW